MFMYVFVHTWKLCVCGVHARECVTACSDAKGQPPVSASLSTWFEKQTLPSHTTVCPWALLRVYCLHLLSPCRITGGGGHRGTHFCFQLSSGSGGPEPRSSGLYSKRFNCWVYLKSSISFDFISCVAKLHLSTLSPIFWKWDPDLGWMYSKYVWQVCFITGLIIFQGLFRMAL